MIKSKEASFEKKGKRLTRLTTFLGFGGKTTHEFGSVRRVRRVRRISVLTSFSLGMGGLMKYGLKAQGKEWEV